MRFAAIINPDASTLKAVDRDWLLETLETRFAERGLFAGAEGAEGSRMPESIRTAAADDLLSASRTPSWY